MNAVYIGQLRVLFCGLGKQKPYVHSGMLGSEHKWTLADGAGEPQLPST